MESSDDDSATPDRIEVAISTGVENVNNVPQRKKATASKKTVPIEAGYQKIENIGNSSPVLNVQESFDSSCKKRFSDIESDDDADSDINEDSIAYVASDVEKIDNIDFDESDISVVEDE